VIREGKLLNLPINLIVIGDHVVLRPGHLVGLNCKSVEKNVSFIFGNMKILSPLILKVKTGEYEYFSCGQKYEPNIAEDDEILDKYEFLKRIPIKKKIPKPIKCIAEETPYIKFLR